MNWNKHPIAHLRRLEKKYGPMTIHFQKYSASGEYGKNKLGIYWYTSQEITEDWLASESAKAIDGNYHLGIMDVFVVKNGIMFLPTIDFKGQPKPQIPPVLERWFGYGPFYKTDESWHLYGDTLFQIGYRNEFFRSLEEHSNATFNLDRGWLKFSREQNYTVLRWTKKSHYPEEQ